MSHDHRVEVPTPGAARGQFVLGPASGLPREGFAYREHDGWRLGTCALPVVELRSRDGALLGWCLGYPVLDGVLVSDAVTVGTSDTARVEWSAVDDLYERLAGRFLLVLLAAEEPTVVLDAYGSLAAVYSADERVVASTTSLIDAEWDTELVELSGFPERGTWLPFGLTLRRGVRRLQANHALDLRQWRTHRHWLPVPASVDSSPAELAVLVHDHIRRSIGAVAAEHPLSLSLTAGRDSRILLACARDFLEQASLFTLVPDAVDTVDAHLARRLAGRFGLRHETLPTMPAAPWQLSEWLSATGHAVSGELWKGHRSLQGLDPGRALLPGTAGEVGRGHTFRPGDPVEGVVDPRTLLQRLRLPADELYLEHAEAWLGGLSALPYESTLELAYIEQRLSCWAGPGHYGNQFSRFEMAPFASRPLFRAMLALPLDYRHGEQLTTDILGMAWPELLELPFNRFTGLRGTARVAASRARRLVRRGVPARVGSRQAT